MYKCNKIIQPRNDEHIAEYTKIFKINFNLKLFSDGFTYERAAINEWFLCGKFTSPLTNEPLKSTLLTTNVPLRNAIFTLLHGDAPSA